jgi:hypothetical protein
MTFSKPLIKPGLSCIFVLNSLPLGEKLRTILNFWNSTTSTSSRLLSSAPELTAFSFNKEWAVSINSSSPNVLETGSAKPSSWAVTMPCSVSAFKVTSQVVLARAAPMAFATDDSGTAMVSILYNSSIFFAKYLAGPPQQQYFFRVYFISLKKFMNRIYRFGVDLIDHFKGFF